MNSVLTELWRTHGILDIAEARLAGDIGFAQSARARLVFADLMALGALADAVRQREVGEVVRVRPQLRAYAPSARKGLDLLREIAVSRITSPTGAAVTVDWSSAGLELAVVALGFGANELAGMLSNKRGLVIADDAAKKMKGEGMVSMQELQKREIARVLAGARRTVVFEGDVVSAQA